MSKQCVTEPLEEYAARIAHALNLAERGLNEEMKISDRLRTELAAEKEAREKAEAMFDECAVARDGAGFIGSVPDCIAFYREATETAEAKLEAAKEALDGIFGSIDNVAWRDNTGLRLSDVVPAVEHARATRATLESDT